jgi:hypothetical protein
MKQRNYRRVCAAVSLYRDSPSRRPDFPQLTQMVSFKCLWLLFEVVFEMIVDWHYSTPVRERRRAKMA